jgi:argininosuccinate lyase
VRHAEQIGVSLRDVPEHDLPQIAPELHSAALQSLSPSRAVAGRAIIGGPAPAQVTREVQRLAAELKGLGYEV